MKHGKKYLEAAKAVDRSIQYDPADAISTVKKLLLNLTRQSKFTSKLVVTDVTQTSRSVEQLFCRTVPENRFVSLFSLKAQKLMRLLQQVQSSLELRS